MSTKKRRRNTERGQGGWPRGMMSGNKTKPNSIERKKEKRNIHLKEKELLCPKVKNGKAVTRTK